MIAHREVGDGDQGCDTGGVAEPGTPPVDATGSICIGCGLCCDGTLFSHLGVIDESDLGRPLQALGVEVIVEADPPVFALPCPAFDGRLCTIHHLHRPRACGWFECDLALAVARGELHLAEAREVIERTRQLRRRVEAGEATDAELRRQVERWFRAPD